MAAQDRTAVWRIPGRVVLNPTNLAAAYPHAGTAVGYTTKQILEWRQIVKEVRAREWVRTIEQHERMIEPRWRFKLLQRDVNLLPKLFKSTASGTGYFRVDDGGYGPPRGNLPAIDELLMSPINTSYPGLLFRRPIVTFEPLATTPLSAKEDASYRLIVTPTPTAAGHGWEWVELPGATL